MLKHSSEQHECPIKRKRRQRLRWSCQCWYPRANDLQLPDVPAGDRAEVRRILNWLGKLPVRGGTCWQTSQAVTLLGRDPRVQYVEGASWIVKNIDGQTEPMFNEGLLQQPFPHGWNLVNGHVVDLLAEFHNWRFGGDWLHEPLKVYTLEDMRAFEKLHGNFSIFQHTWVEQHEDSCLVEPDDMAAICQHLFKEAINGLVQKAETGLGHA